MYHSQNTIQNIYQLSSGDRQIGLAIEVQNGRIIKAVDQWDPDPREMWELQKLAEWMAQPPYQTKTKA